MSRSVQRRFRPGTIVPVRIDVRTLGGGASPILDLLPTFRIIGPQGKTIVGGGVTQRMSSSLYRGVWQSPSSAVSGNYIVEVNLFGPEGSYVEADRFELSDRWL